MVDAPGFVSVKPLREPAPLVRFAGFVLDLDACILARDSGEAVPLTRGELVVLRMFVSRPGRVISRDALLDALANRRFEPFDRSVDVLIGKLRRKIESNPKQPRVIVTVPGEGYRFDALRFRAPQIVELADSDTAAKPEGVSPPRLSIVVLPFANLGGNPEQEYFVDGVTDSLTTDLSRMRGAFVIARNTAFAYKGKPLDAKTIGHELNVRYVLGGSVQRSGSRMRVNVQLIKAETGAHLWAERFDKPLADLFDMQDEIVARLAGALNTELVAAEARRAEQVQGLAWLNKGRTPDNVARARGYFGRALSADPDNVDALIGSARADHVASAFLFATDPAAAFFAAEAKLKRALSSVPDHPGAHMYLGLVQIVTKRAAQGIAECEHALALDRNLVDARSYIGFGKIYIGRAEETEAHIIEALRLSPRDTMAYNWMSYAGIAKNYLGLYDQAILWFRRAIEANRNFPHPHFVLGAALALLGRLDEARCAVRAGLALNPTFTVARARGVWSAMSDDPIRVAQLERLLDGIRKAGAPEG
jgi:TolB-like protein